VIRPPLAAGRLPLVDSKQLIIELTAPWSDGTYQIVLSPLELIEKLAALVPPPRLNLVRYHGVLAPHAAARAQIVPGPQEQDAAESSSPGVAPLAPGRSRRSWAQLLGRVFQTRSVRGPRDPSSLRPSGWRSAPAIPGM